MLYFITILVSVCSSLVEDCIWFISRSGTQRFHSFDFLLPVSLTQVVSACHLSHPIYIECQRMSSHALTTSLMTKRIGRSRRRVTQLVCQDASAILWVWNAGCFSYASLSTCECECNYLDFYTINRLFGCLHYEESYLFTEITDAEGELLIISPCCWSCHLIPRASAINRRGRHRPRAQSAGGGLLASHSQCRSALSYTDTTVSFSLCSERCSMSRLSCPSSAMGGERPVIDLTESCAGGQGWPVGDRCWRMHLHPYFLLSLPGCVSSALNTISLLGQSSRGRMTE